MPELIPLSSAEILWTRYLNERPLPFFSDVIASLKTLVANTEYKSAGAWIFARLTEAENEFLRKD